MDVLDLTVEVRDRDLVRVGQIEPEYLDVRLDPAYDAPGAWSVRLPAEHPMAAALSEPGSGIVVTHMAERYDPPVVVATVPNLVQNPAGVNGSRWETNQAAPVVEGPALGPFGTSARLVRSTAGQALRMGAHLQGLQASTQYSVRLRARASAAFTGVSTTLRPSAASSSGQAVTTSLSLPAGESEWTITFTTTATAPTASAALVFIWSTGAVGATLDVVASVIAGPAAPDLFDGDTPDQPTRRYSWSGQPYVSGPVVEHLVASGIVEYPEVLLSGPTDSPETTAAVNDPEGMATFTGTTDNVLLWQRIAYPTPDQPLDQQVAAYDVVSAIPGETAMQHYVARNLGALARPERRVAALTLEPDQGRGGIVTKTARFDVLGELLASIASVSGLGFRVVQVGDVLEFQTFEVRDRSGLVRLDLHNGTLASRTVKRARPTMTNAIVAGQGEGADRTLVEVVTQDAEAALYGPFARWEGFLDQRQTDDPLELVQAGAEAIADRAGAIAVTAVPGDDSTMAYPADWREGDTIAVVTGDQEPTAQVTAIHILVNAAVGVRVGASIGDVQGWDPQAPLRKRQDDQEQRLGHLERNLESAVQGNVPTAVDLDAMDRTGVWLVDDAPLARTLTNWPVPAIPSAATADALNPAGSYREAMLGTLRVTVTAQRVIQEVQAVPAANDSPHPVVTWRRFRRLDGTWSTWATDRTLFAAEGAAAQDALGRALAPSRGNPITVARTDFAVPLHLSTLDGVQWYREASQQRQATPAVRVLPYLNGWRDYQTGAWPGAQAIRTSAGIVTLRGLVTGGAQGSVIVNLPPGYRPAATVYVLAADPTNTAGSHVEVRPNGDVIWTGNQSNANTFVDLFRAQFPAADVAPHAAWTPITEWANGFGPSTAVDLPGGEARPGWWQDRHGRVWFRGRAMRSGSDPTSDTAMFTVPDALRPNQQVHGATLAANIPRFASLHWLGTGTGSAARTSVFWKVGSPAGSSAWVTLDSIRLFPVAAIPESAWRGLGFVNGWGNWNGGQTPGGVWAAPDGLLHARGLLSGGNGGQPITAQFGAGDRTPLSHLWLTSANNQPARITHDPQAWLAHTSGPAGWYSLEGITWFLEA